MSRALPLHASSGSLGSVAGLATKRVPAAGSGCCSRYPHAKRGRGVGMSARRGGRSGCGSGVQRPLGLLAVLISPFRDLYRHLGECVDLVAGGAEVGCEGAEWDTVGVGAISARIQRPFAENSETFGGFFDQVHAVAGVAEWWRGCGRFEEFAKRRSTGRLLAPMQVGARARIAVTVGDGLPDPPAGCAAGVDQPTQPTLGALIP